MAAVEKFLFGRDFAHEADPPAAPAASGPAEAAPDPAPEPEPAPGYSEADLEQARAEARSQAHAEGVAEGRRQAEAEADAALTAAHDRLAAAIAELGQAAAARADRRDREQLDVAVKLVERLFPAFTRRHGLSEIEAVLRDCLERLRDEPRVVVRLCDRLLDPMKERVDALAQKAGFEGRIVLLVDEEIADGDVRVEWADGGAERDNARLWRDIDAALGRLSEAPADAGGRTASAGAGARSDHNQHAPSEAGSPAAVEVPAEQPGQARRSA
jgi:flagellar assembly protein FliH